MPDSYTDTTCYIAMVHSNRTQLLTNELSDAWVAKSTPDLKFTQYAVLRDLVIL